LLKKNIKIAYALSNNKKITKKKKTNYSQNSLKKKIVVSLNSIKQKQKKLKLKYLKKKKIPLIIKTILKNSKKLKKFKKIFKIAQLTNKKRDYSLLLGFIGKSIYSTKIIFNKLKLLYNFKFLHNESKTNYPKNTSLYNLYNIFFKNKKAYLQLKVWFIKKKIYSKTYSGKRSNSFLYLYNQENSTKSNLIFSTLKGLNILDNSDKNKNLK
jgi:hypothetical protein